MAEKGTEKTNAAECYPVERLKTEMKVSDEVHAGVCIAMGWSTGKEVSKKEYETAVKLFKKKAAGGRRDA